MWLQLLTAAQGILKVSSTRSIPPNRRTSTMSTPMDNGKGTAPSADFRNGNAGGSGTLINVQPLRSENLQPAYAQTLMGESEDAGTHGWYGSMSMGYVYPDIYRN